MMQTDAPLMVSISGIRGISGKSLTPDIIQTYISAFGNVVNGKRIVVGRDSRSSGPAVLNIVSGVLMMQGYEVIDLGLCTTPTCQVMTEHLNADAGIVITASHNPAEWNGLKFIDANGLFFSPEKCRRMFAMAETDTPTFADWSNQGQIRSETDSDRIHIEKILNLDYIQSDRIRKREFTVVVDVINGAGANLLPTLLADLGCNVIVINGDVNGRFNHTPEPVPANLTQLCDAVQEVGADFGIAVDPDADRCVFVDHTGTPIGEEYTLVIATKFMLHHKLGMVVKNMSTTLALDDVANYYNCKVYESAVGEINVANKMIEMNAVIGGEGNGGVMLPDIHIGRDSAVAAAMVIAALVEFDESLAGMRASLPQYEIVKKKLPLDGMDPDVVIDSLARQSADLKISRLDGLKIYGDTWWVHLRKSNTEPIVRVIAEAKTAAEAAEMCDLYMEKIRALN